jgi:tetratricopeptide (TPR) repeat protein
VQEARSLIEHLLMDYPDDPNVKYAAGRYHHKIEQFPQACAYFKKTIDENPENIDAHIYLATTFFRDGTHRAAAKCRDVLLNLLQQNPDFLKTNALGEFVTNLAAKCCQAVGPKEKSIDLWRELAEMTDNADYYYQLSEDYAFIDLISEAEIALKRAIELNPEKYAKSSHQETLKLLDISRSKNDPKNKVKKHTYPSTQIFQGDLKSLICNHIATEHKAAPKLISKSSVIFTMGSCFARNIARSLRSCAYDAEHMELSESINTTFANKYFFNWVNGDPMPPSLNERIEQLLPDGFSKSHVLEKLKCMDVFILTLGVAPAFFDRRSGEFVMPRPTAINSRAMAELYQQRTTTVDENISNLLELISYIKSINKYVSIIVTVSPVPLHITFEFNSCVVADCLSKSTMRLVAHEIVNNNGVDNIYYWPSFEIFRWAGSHAEHSFFGSDDGASWHVSEAVVDTTIQSFVELFAGT